MNQSELVQLIKSKRSFLCVGLDSDIAKIPSSLMQLEDPVFEFNKRIIDATLPYTIAYKPNLAFYEALGSKGMASLEKTMDYIQGLSDSVFTIADAKRGDIGNTAAMYAKAFFERMNFDAVTVSPYMGMDSLEPFLSYKDKWTIVLALTSNAGSGDFQKLHTSAEYPDNTTTESKKLYEAVMEKSIQAAGHQSQLMFVVGATHGEMIRNIRAVAPDNFLLVPGVGAQGGSLSSVAENGLNGHCGLLVNASRSIIFASSEEDFEKAAAAEASMMQKEMEQLLRDKEIID